FQPFTTVHGDQRHRVGWPFVFFLPLGVEGDFFEKRLQAIERRLWSVFIAVQRGDEVLEVADAAFSGFGSFFGTAQLVEITDFVQPTARPGVERSSRRK